MSTRPPLPEKKYFKIGEVADLVGVEPHVLRYWETQFPQLRPHKARSGHRLYRRREVETLLVIRELLHVQRFTIAGARQALRQPGGAASLLPRFFGDGADGAGDAIEAGADDGATAPPTLVQDASTSPDGDPESPESDVISVEAVGLDDEELRSALERQGAARSARGDDLVEVEVVAVTIPPRAAPALAAGGGALSVARRRGLLEGALAEARAIVALLDREDAACRRLHA